MSTESFQHVSRPEAFAYPVSFKITHPSQALARRLRFTTPPSWKSLSTKLTELWGIPLSSLAVSYIDSAGDRCVLSSDEELRDFYDEVRGEGKEKDVVKMRVVVLERAEDQELQLSEAEKEAKPTKQPASGPDSESIKNPTSFDLDKVKEALDSAADKQTTEVDKDVDSLLDYIGTILPQGKLPSDGSGRLDSTTNPSHPMFTPSAAPFASSSSPSADPPLPTTPSLTIKPEAAVHFSPAPSIQTDDAPDPEEVFPDDLPTAADSTPSLLADLSSLLAAFSSSPALATLVNRAASGAYTPHLASHFASERTHLHEGINRAKDTVEKAKADVERGLGAGASGLEALTGLFEGVMVGAKEAMEKGREREKERRKEAESSQKNEATMSTTEEQTAEGKTEEKVEAVPEQVKDEKKVEEYLDDRKEEAFVAEMKQGSVTLPPPPPFTPSTPFGVFPSLSLKPNPTNAFSAPAAPVPTVSHPHGHPSHICNPFHPFCAPPALTKASFLPPPPPPHHRPHHRHGLFDQPHSSSAFAHSSSGNGGSRFDPPSGPPPLFAGFPGTGTAMGGGGGGGLSMPGGFGSSSGGGGLFGRSEGLSGVPWSGQTDREREQIVAQRIEEMGFDPSQYRLDIADLANQEKTEAGLLAAVVRRIVTGGGIGSSGSNRRW